MGCLTQQRQDTIRRFSLTAIGGADPGLIHILLIAEANAPGLAFSVNHLCFAIRLNLLHHKDLTIANTHLRVIPCPPQLVAYCYGDRLGRVDRLART